MSWLATLQSKAALKASTIGFPTPKQEAWKYADLSIFQKLDFSDSLAFQPVKTSFMTEGDISLSFINGKPVSSNNPSLPEGVTLRWFSDLSDSEKQSFQTLFPSIENESGFFSLINLSHFSEAMVVKIADNQVIETPIYLKLSSAFLSHSMTHLRIMIQLGENSKASVVVIMEDQGQNENCQTVAIDVSLAQHAALSLGMVSSDERFVYRFNHVRATLESSSDFKFTTISKGSAQARHDISVDFKGENAVSELSGISLLSGSTQVFTHTKVNHYSPSTTSTQLFKNILMDQARSEYNGRVYVHPGSQLTDSSQRNHNLLLSDDARAYSRPQLEIYADDVKCAHGATIGQLNEQELFYLQSRGLSIPEARAILLHGFVEEVVDRFPQGVHSEPLKTWVNTALSHVEEASV